MEIEKTNLRISPTIAFRGAVVLVLLIGAVMRFSSLGLMADMLGRDESFYAVDALSLLREPRFTPFFPTNYGHESLWCYILAPFIAVFGARPFSLHLAATFTGVLTVAAVYRFGKEILSARAALWACFALSVSHWHVHLSRTTLRAILFPLVGALAFAALFRAYRTNRIGRWIIAGAWLGLLGYTYFSATFWIAYALLFILWWGVQEPDKRRGVLIAVTMMALILLPLILYGIRHPQEMTARSQITRAASVAEVWNNGRAWFFAWFRQGDLNTHYNPLGRPVMDPRVLPLFIAGLGALIWAVKKRWYALGLVGLMMVSILPSLLTHQAPHFLRAIGLIVPLVLTIGAGVWGTERVLRPLRLQPLVWLLITVLFTLVAVTTYQDCYIRWPFTTEVFMLMEQHIHQSTDFIRTHLPGETSVYFSPFSPSHPVVAFRSADLAPRYVGAFDSHTCLVVPESPAVYVSVTLYEPEFGEKLSRWADISVLHQDPAQSPPRYQVFYAAPHLATLQDLAATAHLFGERIMLNRVAPVPATAAAGDTIPVELALKATAPLDRDYILFLHLYGDPTPYEGGPLWSQSDRLICEPYPSSLWRTNEWVIQTFSLPVPADIPAGRYLVAAGVYELPSGARLPFPAGKHDFLPLGTVDIQNQAGLP